MRPALRQVGKSCAYASFFSLPCAYRLNGLSTTSRLKAGTRSRRLMLTSSAKRGYPRKRSRGDSTSFVNTEPSLRQIDGTVSMVTPEVSTTARRTPSSLK